MKKIIATIIFLVLFSFAFFGSVFAFQTGFENYNLGAIAGQQGWTGDATYFLIATSTHTGVSPYQGEKLLNAGPGVIYNAYDIYKDVEHLETSLFDFWISWPGDGAGDKQVSIGSIIFGLNNAGVVYFNGVNQNWTLSVDTWTRFRIQIDHTNQRVRIRQNEDAWRNWVDKAFDIPTQIRVHISSGGRYSLDNLNYAISQPEAPTISPTYPVSGATTTSSQCKFVASGDYWFDPSDPIDYTDIILKISSGSYASGTYYENFFFASSTISATTTGSYTIPISIPYSGDFNVQYIFQGSQTDPNCITYPCYEQMVLIYPEIATTTLSCTSGFLPPYAEPVEPDLFILDEKPSGILEGLTWELKHLFVGIFYPTQAARQKLINAVDNLKTKGPLNYLIATRDFFSGLTLSPTTTLPVVNFSLESLTGSTSSLSVIDFSMSSLNVDIGTQSKTIIYWIKLMTSFALTILLVGGVVQFIRYFWL